MGRGAPSSSARSCLNPLRQRSFSWGLISPLGYLTSAIQGPGCHDVDLNIGYYCRWILQWREARVATAAELHIAPGFDYGSPYPPSRWGGLSVRRLFPGFDSSPVSFADLVDFGCYTAASLKQDPKLNRAMLKTCWAKSYQAFGGVN